MADESKSGSEGPCNELFKGFPLSLFELPPTGDIVVIPSDASIAEAVAILGKVCPLSNVDPSPRRAPMHVIVGMSCRRTSSLRPSATCRAHTPILNGTNCTWDCFP